MGKRLKGPGALVKLHEKPDEIEYGGLAVVVEIIDTYTRTSYTITEEGGWEANETYEEARRPHEVAAVVIFSEAPRRFPYSYSYTMLSTYANNAARQLGQPIEVDLCKLRLVQKA